MLGVGFQVSGDSISDTRNLTADTSPTMSDSISNHSDAGSSDGRYTVIARRYRPQAFDELVGQEHVARALQQAIIQRTGWSRLFVYRCPRCRQNFRGPHPGQSAQLRERADSDAVQRMRSVPARGGRRRRRRTGDRRCEQPRHRRDSPTAAERGRAAQPRAVQDLHHRRSPHAHEGSVQRAPENAGRASRACEIHLCHDRAAKDSDHDSVALPAIRFCRNQLGGDSGAISQIAAAEGVAVEPAALQILASRAAGSMRDSQSLLEQLLAMGHEKITADDVNQLLGIAPAERLTGLVRHLVARDASAALAELDATIQSGVEVGLLLDQLVGYFRDVMTTAVGCPPDQMLYALPSQADEVADVGRQLGLSTVLAIGQILDHTAARLRVSIHARTLVEMAIVRICQLGELDDLAALVAELRGATSGQTAKATVPENRPSSTTPAIRPQSQVAAKKNDEPRVETSERTTDGKCRSNPIQRHDAAHAVESSTNPVDDAHAESAPPESVLAQWKRAIANGEQPKSEATPPRPSRREQLAQVAEQPFVRRAMELFDVAPGQFRYTPPENGQNQ